jgi:uncharacterized NAD(P)/FAD-binding protein YdhS
MVETCPLSVAIIGAGFSGALLAVHLLERIRPEDTIYLIERRSGFGRGLAYSTGNPNHLLNVRAGNMSAFPDDPRHFIRWLEERARDAGALKPTADSFVSRRLYGQYIQNLLSDELWKKRRSASLCLVPDEAVALSSTDDGVIVSLAAGNQYEVDVAVIATGNLSPDRSVGAYVGDPWARDACEGLSPTAPVLLIGSGLTMVDLVVSLLDNGHRGPVYALSRRGLLPHTHVPTAPIEIASQHLPRTTSLLRLLSWLRAEARKAEAAGQTWHALVDGVRPFVPDLWRVLPLEERRRFLRHVRPYWDIHRHRLAPDVNRNIAAARDSGQLSVIAGRIVSINPESHRVVISYRQRASDFIETLEVARAINRSGPETNYEACRDPLLQGLLASGVVRPDALRLGLDVTETGQLIARNGNVSNRLFALGPVTRGLFWEVVAVPDIRMHCARLARLLSDAVLPPLRDRAARRAGRAAHQALTTVQAGARCDTEQQDFGHGLSDPGADGRVGGRDRA